MTGGRKENHTEPCGGLRITEAAMLTTVLCHKNAICCAEEILFLVV